MKASGIISKTWSCGICAVARWMNCATKSTWPSNGFGKKTGHQGLLSSGQIKTLDVNVRSYKAAEEEIDTRTVTGEIIDITCYFRHDSRGEKHVKCATYCVNLGMPLGLLEDETSKVYLIIPPGHEDQPFQGDISVFRLARIFAVETCGFVLSFCRFGRFF